MKWPLSCLLAAVLVAPAVAQEKDIFNYVAQKNAGANVKKIVFIADPDTHGGKGNHEFKAGAVYMARTLNATFPNCYATVYRSKKRDDNKKWIDAMPTDLSHADAIIVLLNHGGVAATNKAVIAATEKGAGFMAIHYGVEVNKGAQGDNYLKWIGGYFETFYSVNPFWVAKFDKIPEHETTRGVKPFSINDEWYYHMRFPKDMKGVTPVLSAVAPLETITKRWDGKKAGSHNGNEFALESVKKGEPQHVAWAFVRPDGGRGFGFTGYHNYNNITNDSFRTLLLNAAAWTAKLEVPMGGVPSKTPTKDDLEKLWQDGERIPN
jgi:trehalose utilization protein